MLEYKITRKMMDDYRKEKREISVLEMELLEMQKSDNGFSNSTIFDYRTGFPRPQSVVGFDWPLYERRRKIIENKKKKLRAVEKWIDNIEEGETRCVFRMYYIDGMTWEKIASRIGYAASPDYPRLYIRDKYLRKNKIC